MNQSHEIAVSLLEKARGDRKACYALAADPEIPAWLAGFHAQQAVEKALKSVLAYKLVEYPRTHNLSMLIGLLRINNLPLPPNAEEIPQLTPFGIAFRYEDTSPKDEKIPIDRIWATECVDRTILWAESILY
jgi:HEPN domain-containing protein